MSKPRIKLRRGDFSSQRIEKHKNYGQLMEQHQRSSGLKVNNYLVGFVVLACVVGVSYYALDRIENMSWPEASGTTENEQIIKEVEPIQEKVTKEVSPQPKGGLNAYNLYLQQNIKLPEEDFQEGIVYVTFNVETDGSLTELRILKGLCDACDQLALELIADGPDWVPATSNDQPIKAPMVVPITFALEAGVEPLDTLP